MGGRERWREGSQEAEREGDRERKEGEKKEKRKKEQTSQGGSKSTRKVNMAKSKRESRKILSSPPSMDTAKVQLHIEQLSLRMTRRLTEKIFLQLRI